MRLGTGKNLTVLVFLLVIFGLAILASAGVVEGQKKFGEPYYFFKHQLLYGILPGLLLFFLTARIDYRFWQKISLPLLLTVVGLMVLVFVPSFGLTIKGAQRWLDFGFITLQPAELLKLVLIIYLAAWFSQRSAHLSSHWVHSILPFAIVLGFVGGLLVMQPDIKTLALVTLIAVSLYFFAGAKLTHILLFVLTLLIILAGLSLAPYRLNRIKAYLNPTIDPQGVSYHINQALLGIGSGGLFGRGYGQSQQKINYLPEPVGDSIFAILVEEVGFVGGGIVLGLFILLMFSLISIAKNCHNQFGRLYVLGITVWIMAQTFINISAIINLIPLTGVPLPFFSYGSSALVTLLVALGITVNIAKHT